MAKTPRYKQTLPQENEFTRILADGVYRGIIPSRTKEAREWYRRKASGIGEVHEPTLMKSEPSRFRQMVVPGRMYMFYYDPKHKDTLPYYDRFPLIFPIDVRGDHFLGLNLHYLPPQYRAKLMDALYSLVNNNRYDETTKIQLSYRILKASANLKYFKPCIKKYLKRHVRSRFVAVAANEWDIALFLPLERFEKEPNTKVWSDSVQKIRFGR